MENRFNIPDLTPMYEAVRDFVKEHQGESGEIVLDPQKGTIYAFVYDGYGEYREKQIQKIRVRGNSLQVLVEYWQEDTDNEEDAWDSVKYGDFVYFTPTIFNIATDIESFV